MFAVFSKYRTQFRVERLSPYFYLLLRIKKEKNKVRGMVFVVSGK